jgi:DNA-binding NarL/FixJ family response regulator
MGRSALLRGERVPEGTETTVVIADDHLCFAEMLAASLTATSGWRCMGIAGSAEEAVRMAARFRPTYMIIDIRMPGTDGLSATRQVREVAPATKVAVMSANSDADWISRAAHAGAAAYISKDGSLSEMMQTLSRASSAHMAVSPSTFAGGGYPATSAADDRPDLPGPPALTQRELDVLRCIGRGLQAKGIARVLGISVHTCRGYIKSLYVKLDVSSRLEALVKAREWHLLGASDGV